MAEDGVRIPQLSDQPGAPPYDPAELDEDVDLEIEYRRRLLDLFYGMKDRDHYALLGVPRAADKKSIKRAYYDLAGHFHPDKYFRKRLGSFKAKMEAVFGRLTLAHDVLTDREQRAEYDGYLNEHARTQGIEDMLKDVLSEITRAEEAAKHEVELGLQTVAPVPAAPVPAAPVPIAITPAAPEPAKPSVPAADITARRNALAQRLLGGRPPPRPSSAATPRVAGSQPHDGPDAAMAALRRRYEERMGQAKRFQAKKYADNGALAMAQNDPVAAANAYRVAIGLLPEDEQLKRTYEEAQRAADTVLSESYERQAAYEEKSNRWDEASRSWCKVALARPDDANVHERAANAIVRANGNLHEASKLGRRAVELEPANYHYKVTLAQVYIAAGLHLNAKRELEAAAQLSPHDGTIQTLLKRVAKT